MKLKNQSFRKECRMSMKIIKTADYEALSKKAANLIAAQVLLKPNCVLGLATGSTPIGTYQNLVEWYKKGELDFSKVTSVNLDEYVGLDGSNEQSYRYFMNHHLFEHINILRSNTYVPNGIANDWKAECEDYDRMISELGGIDLQLLGIGQNGHIGFNEPAEVFTKNTHLVDLGESTIQANARFFSNIEEVPKQALTMGIGAIMQAKKVLLIANGKEKEEIVKKAFYGPITPQVPASILQLHSDLTVICCF